jgi:hypothetical protein
MSTAPTSGWIRGTNLSPDPPVKQSQSLPARLPPNRATFSVPPWRKINRQPRTILLSTWQAPKNGSAAKSIQPTDYSAPAKTSNSNGRRRPASAVQNAETQPSNFPTCGILGLSIEDPSHTKRTTRIEREERKRLLQLTTYSKTSIEFPLQVGRPTAFRKTRRSGSERSERSMRESFRDCTHTDTE